MNDYLPTALSDAITKAERALREPAPPTETGLNTAVIAERVRQARFAMNMTQQQLAGATFSKGYISAIERGKMVPSIRALNILAERLGQPLSFFLGESQGDLDVLLASPPAMRALPKPERRQHEEAARLDLQMADNLINRGELEEAKERLNLAANQPPETLALYDRPRWYYLAGRSMAYSSKSNDQTRAAQAPLKEAVRMAEELLSQAPPSQQAQLVELAERARNLLGETYYMTSQSKTALELHRQCLAAIIAGRITNIDLKASIYGSLGSDYLALSDHAQAILHYQKSLQLAQEAKNERQQALARWGLGLVYKAIGDLPNAKLAFKQAVIIFDQRDLKRLDEHPEEIDSVERRNEMKLAARVRAMLAQVLILIGDYEEADTLLRQSLGAAERTKDTHSRAIAYGNYARLHRTKGEFDQALQKVQTGLEITKGSKDDRTEGQLHQILAEVYEAQKNTSAAEVEYRQALAILTKTQDKLFIGPAHEQYGHFLASQGRFQEALEQAEQAYSLQATQAEDR